MLRVAWMVALVVLISGCTGVKWSDDTPPDLPAIFHIDDIDYWWESEEFVVRVTFTNQHPNFTPGTHTFDPEIKVWVDGFKIVSERKDVAGDDTRMGEGGGSHRLEFSDDETRDWKERYRRSDFVGPLKIPPGTSLTAEFGFELESDYQTENDGYYTISVRMPTRYPSYMYSDGDQGKEDAYYETGCFNHVVSEFYGVKEDGPDCPIWDCTGEATGIGWSYSKAFGPPPEEMQPICSATSATGPEYPPRDTQTNTASWRS